MRFLKQSLLGLFLAAMTAGLAVYAGSLVYGAVQARMNEEPRAARNRERVFSVRVVTAEPKVVTPVLSLFGQIQSGRTLELRAASKGRIISLNPAFVEGGRVEAGMVLASIDPADAETVLARMQSNLRDAELEALEARNAVGLANDEQSAAQEQADLRTRAFERQTDLQRRGVGTAAAVEVAELAAASARQSVLTRRQALAQARARVDQSESNIDRAKLALNEAQRALDDTRLIAEFDGVLSDVSAVQGGLVSANEQLAELIDPDALEISVRVSTTQYARLLDDQGTLGSAPVRVYLDGLGTALTASGTLTRDSAAVGEGQSGRLLFAELGPAPGFKPGDFVRIEIDEPQISRVATLPASAYGADGAVLAIDGEGRIESVPVTLLRRQGDTVLVRAPGLRGRDIVAARTPLLGSGIKVKPLKDADATKIEEPEMLELSDERRAKLRAFVEANTRMPDEAKQRILSQLDNDKVPAQMVTRIESRMGG